MRAKSLWKFAIPLCLFSDPAAAEVTIENLLAMIRGMDSSSTSSDDCVDQLRRSADMNGAELFYGAAVCTYAGQEDDAAFLLLTGQIRSSADASSFEPDGPEGLDAMAELWRLIFFSELGGAGADSLYRDVRARVPCWHDLMHGNPICPATTIPAGLTSRHPI